MNKPEYSIDPILLALRDPQTIRQQANRVLQLAQEDKLKHFGINHQQLIPTASYVIDVITAQYPKLDIPYHSRWRHFEISGIDRVKKLSEHLSDHSVAERGKIYFELIIISVLLDAGAGTVWRFKEPMTGNSYSRSEGLAVASLALYQSGAFSADPNDPLRVDAEKLLAFTEQELQLGLQISVNNPLDGVAGRVSLLNQLGKMLRQNTTHFGSQGRLGDFYSYIKTLQINNHIAAKTLFQAVLDAFQFIWPTRLVYQGISLGDVGIHQALKTEVSGSEYLPFHKLSQWLTYSLIEPLVQSGIQVTDLDVLTGLPEYRNGGLLIDSELLTVKNKALFHTKHDPSSEIIVEWRALTVALLDELALLIRKQLNKDHETLPLVKILQGGTWAAGRQIAKQKRPEGTPPIQIISDGTLF